MLDAVHGVSRVSRSRRVTGNMIRMRDTTFSLMGSRSMSERTYVMSPIESTGSAMETDSKRNERAYRLSWETKLKGIFGMKM
jgi:hypothetical protein